MDKIIYMRLVLAHSKVIIYFRTRLTRHDLVSSFGVMLGSFKARFKQLPKVLTKAVYGPWWWSSGRRACLLLRQSEFESR